ncbi:MAG: hypothetical protein EA362_14015 [Saprospirales bacterium]|nr:MAG: hypothetical protein EA362_14015 [Saprospirales bacterium]
MLNSLSYNQIIKPYTMVTNIERILKLENKKRKKNEPPTTCMRNSGFCAKSKVSAFKKSQCQTESPAHSGINSVLRNRHLRVAAKRQTV